MTVSLTIAIWRDKTSGGIFTSYGALQRSFAAIRSLLKYIDILSEPF